MYKGKKRNEVPPHLFSISDNAYHDMLMGKRFFIASLYVSDTSCRPAPQFHIQLNERKECSDKYVQINMYACIAVLHLV